MTSRSATDAQHTLRAPAGFRGFGLFTGAPAAVTFHPAPPGAGRFFRRTDLPGEPIIPARLEHAAERQRRTALERDGASIETVEHCLSALAALGVDNARIDLDGPELPAGDGSALPFVDAILEAGLLAQDAPRRPIIVVRTVTVSGPGCSAAAHPLARNGDPPEFRYELDYGPGAPIPPQSHVFRADPGVYARDIAPARTFSTRDEAEAARARGLFSHLSPRDMLVIDHAGPVDNAYRLPDEPARHKLVDLIGDLALLDRPIRARIAAIKSGHALNVELARAILRAHADA